MGDIYVEHRLANRRLKVECFSPDQVRRDITCSINELKKLLKRNEACFTDEGLEIYFGNQIAYTIGGDFKYERASIAIVEALDAESVEYIRSGIEQFESIIALNKSFLNKIDKGDTIDSTYVEVKLKTVVPHTTTAGSLVMMRSILGATCHQCGQHHRYDAMPDHKLSPACPIEAAKKEMLDKGWVRLEDMSQIMAVLRSGIDTEAKAEHYGIWAPPWVKQALETFRSSGYADMSLEEYLSKMKP